MNWEQISEFLPLVLLLALWSLSKFLRKDTEPDDYREDEPEDATPEKGSIEEEIRRKIAERKAAASGFPQEATEVQEPWVLSTEELTPLKTEPLSSMAEQASSMEEVLAEQKRQVEQTQASARELQKQLAHTMVWGKEESCSRQTAMPKYAEGYWINEWRNHPDSLQRMLIDYEIFSAPLSLRRPDGSSRPLWHG